MSHLTAAANLMPEKEQYVSRSDLDAALPDITSAPSLSGPVRRIVVRPQSLQRTELNRVLISADGGVDGDRWVHTSWMHLADGRSHPDVQISLVNVRAMEKIAKTAERWPLSGDNFFVDLDLSKANLPAGQRLRLGHSVIEISAVPHMPCKKYVDRFGVDAAQFVACRTGRDLRLRGVYAKVIEAGHVEVGDMISTLP